MQQGSVLLTIVSLSCCLPALAQQPTSPPAVAIVEDVEGSVRGAELLEYIEAGRGIDASRGTVVLNYLQSCLRETVRGGRIVTGERESMVTDGRVERAEVRCDGGKLVMADAQAGKSGAMAYRGTKSGAWGRATLPPASVTIYGTSPMITLTGPADHVLIERLDRSGSIITLRPSSGKIDMANGDKRLEPGGLYKAEAGGRSVVFLVDSTAKPGNEPLVSRLLRL